MTDKLFYFSKSQDKPVGKGVNEYCNDPNKYNELDKIKDWRKVLSNFYVAPFRYDGNTWKTVEHAFQSKKIELVDKDKAFLFCIESSYLIGLGDGLIARKYRKLVELDKKTLELWDSIKNGIMEEIMYAKFSQNMLAKNILKLTMDAELWHAGAREKPSRQVQLENVRCKLLQE
jgi:ribA/ribD-fused uncharacterized protein